MGNYKSEYTGAEHDLVIGKGLGDKYLETTDPGCHLIGAETSIPQNLYDVKNPGKYTIRFYYDMDGENNVIYMPFAGNSPIFLQVSYEGDHHWQRITIGAGLYYRDLNSRDYTWQFKDLGVQAIEVIDNLTSEDSKAALSANMGRHLKHIIDTQEIGNINLCNNSGLKRGTECWALGSINAVTRDTEITFNGYPTFKVDGSGLDNETAHASFGSSFPHHIPVEFGMQYTASIWVKSHSQNAKPWIEMDYRDKDNAWLEAVAKTEIVLDPIDEWTRMTLTFRVENRNATNVWFRVGTFNFGVVSFALPKLEYGQYATQWMPSYYDMWCEFDNANFLNEIFVDIEDIKDHQGIIYNAEAKSFINEYIAIGGGGGFVQSKTAPACTEVLWYNLSDRTEGAAGKFYRYDDNSEKWVKALPPAFCYSPSYPDDTELAWLDNREENETKPSVLNYYDPVRKTWRAIGAAPSVNWVFSEVPPERTDRMWVQLPQFILKLYYQDAWVPIHAIWGENITT